MINFFKRLHAKFSSLLWFIVGVELLIVIYLLAPPPVEPVIVIDKSFAILTGQNLMTEDGGKATYKVTVTKDLDMALTVTLAYDGSATLNTDFKAPKTVVIKKGELSTTFEINAINDNLREGSETLIVKIANITGKRFLEEFTPLDRAGVVYTLIQDEAKPIRENQNTASVALKCDKQLIESAKTGECYVSISEKALEPIHIALSYSGTATLTKDFTAPKTVTINKGKQQSKIKIDLIDDVEKETNEQIIVSIKNIDDVAFEDLRITNATSTINLADEKTPTQPITLSLKANKSTVIEGDTIAYRLSLSQPALSDMTVYLKHSNNTDDFIKTNKVHFNKGDKSQQFTVKVIDDNKIENHDIITYAIDSIEQTGFEAVVANKGVKTKLKDKPITKNPDLQTAYLTVTTQKPFILENEAFRKVQITTSQTVEQDLKLTLNYQGSAKKGKDFSAPVNALIKKGQKQTAIIIKPLDDNLREGKETITVSAKLANKAGLEDLRVKAPLTLTLQDEAILAKPNQQTDFITLSCPKNVTENSKLVTCTVKNSSKAIKAIKVSIAYQGTAKQNTDYIAPSFITIKKGKTTAKLKIKLIDDVLLENKETLNIQLLHIEQNGLEDIRFKQATQTLLINDEKHPSKHITLTLSGKKRVIEGQATPYTLQLSQKAVKDITVYLQHSKNTQQFNAINKVVIPKGATDLSFTVKTLDDNIIEKKSYISYAILSTQQQGFESLIANKKPIKTHIIDEPIKKQADNDTAYLSLTAGKTIIEEDALGIKLLAKLNQTALQRLKLRLSFSGDAIHNKDYTSNKIITIKKGENTGFVLLKPINDNILEGQESINIAIKKLGNAGLEDLRTQAPLTLNLIDENNAQHSAKARLKLSGPKSISEPNTSKNYVLKLNQRANQDLLVKLRYAGSASAQDYIAVNQVVIKKATKRATFKIKTLDDAEVENVEFIDVSIASISGGGFENIEFSKTTINSKITDEKDIAKEFKKYITEQVVSFDTGSIDINEQSKPTLNKIAALLAKFNNAKLVIEGHTNSIGRAKKNQRLSQARAENIKSYLISIGINSNRIKAIGFGETKPLLNDSNPKAMEVNKRVEFSVTY